MKKHRLLFLILALSTAVASSFGGTVTGTLQGPSGLTIKNGTLDFNLLQAGLIVGTGSVVPLTASCYTSTNGAVVGLPNPAANVAASVNYGSGSMSSAMYYVETTFYSGNQETLPSPELRIQLSSAGTLIISPPPSFPAGAAGMRVYIGTASGEETLQGQTTSNTSEYLQATALAAGSPPPLTNNSACSIAFNDTIIPYSGYNVSLISSSGNAYPGWPQAWQLNGGLNGTVDISNGAPLWNGVIVYPQPIVAQPLNNGPQSISGPLNLSGYNLVDVGAIGVGTATPSWPIDVENGSINAAGGYLYNGTAPLNHILLGNGAAYVDSATAPASAISGLFYQTVESGATVEPQEPALNFSTNFAITDNSGVSTSVDLSSSGVTAGSYTNANVTVDSHGRVTTASNGTSIPVIESLIITSGICTTPDSAGQPCSFAATWPSAFTDTGYAVTCTTGIPTPTSGPASANLYISAKTMTGFTITLQAGQGNSTQATTIPEVDCIGEHP